MSSQTGRPEYLCSVCHEPVCTCGKTPQRTAMRDARVYDVLSFPCLRPPCRKVFTTVMERLAHVEQSHSHALSPTVGDGNGVTPCP